MTEPQPKKSDLPVRVASAVVMIAVAGAALWLGGWPFAAFASVVALGVCWEWWGLVARFAKSAPARAVWMTAGLLYVGQAVIALIALRRGGIAPAVTVLALVIAIDVGAYFAGRAIGGPKIAPRISPSKTWAGLGGAVLGAAAVLLSAASVFADLTCLSSLTVIAVAALAAAVAQTGDFFESWMKRRAGVKDSGTSIPGHGGLFDRTDGLIAVLAVIGIGYRLAL